MIRCFPGILNEVLVCEGHPRKRIRDQHQWLHPVSTVFLIHHSCFLTQRHMQISHIHAYECAPLHVCMCVLFSVSTCRNAVVWVGESGRVVFQFSFLKIWVSGFCGFKWISGSSMFSFQSVMSLKLFCLIVGILLDSFVASDTECYSCRDVERLFPSHSTK